MCKDVPAVFVGATYGENMLITDIFALRDGSFRNMTIQDEMGMTVETVREYYVYSSDIDDDGLIELPRPVALPPLPGDSNSENQSLIQWFNLLTNGKTEEKAVTYHNYSAGWFMLIPQEWKNSIAVTRLTDQNASQIYSFVELSTKKELFAITSVNGEKSQDFLDNGEWFQLAQKGDITYACRVQKAAGLTQQELKDLFQFIRMDWNTGET
jgi:hypothetical protein